MQEFPSLISRDPLETSVLLWCPTAGSDMENLLFVGDGEIWCDNSVNVPRLEKRRIKNNAVLQFYL